MLQCYILTVNNKKDSFNQNVFAEAVKILNLITPRPLDIHLYNILHDKMAGVHKAFLLLHIQAQCLSQNKATVQLLELQFKSVTFLIRSPF